MLRFRSEGNIFPSSRLLFCLYVVTICSKTFDVQLLGIFWMLQTKSSVGESWQNRTMEIAVVL